MPRRCWRPRANCDPHALPAASSAPGIATRKALLTLTGCNQAIVRYRIRKLDSRERIRSVRGIRQAQGAAHRHHRPRRRGSAFHRAPWLAAFAGSALAAAAVGYLLATSYLVFRDDLIGAADAQQARMQQAYEDRISALRAQVDRITSRQLLDQQVMETKVCELLERQTQLSRRHGRLGPLLERAESEVGKTLPDAVPAPGQRPDDGRRRRSTPTPQLASRSAGVESGPFDFWSTRGPAPHTESAADRAVKCAFHNRSLPQHRERADRPADAAGGSLR